METAAWYQAAHSIPPSVLGLKLRPYSLGCEILLARFNSGFVEDGSEDGQLIAELSLAVLICSQEYASAVQFLDSPWLVNLFLKVWRYAIRRQTKRHARKILQEQTEETERGKSSSPLSPLPPVQSYFDSELSKFLAYRKAASWFPAENRPIEGRSLAGPWPFRWLAWLMAELNFTEEQALDYPLARATVLYCSRQEFLGKLQLFNEQDDALFAARDALDAANAWDSPNISEILRPSSPSGGAE